MCANPVCLPVAREKTHIQQAVFTGPLIAIALEARSGTRNIIIERGLLVPTATPTSRIENALAAPFAIQDLHEVVVPSVTHVLKTGIEIENAFAVPSAGSGVEVPARARLVIRIPNRLLRIHQIGVEATRAVGLSGEEEVEGMEIKIGEERRDHGMRIFLVRLMRST